MKDATRLTRGRFAAALLGAALVPSGAALRPWRVLAEREARDPATRLARILGDPVATRAIGAEYARARPAEADAHALVDALARGLAGDPGALAAASQAELRRLLAERTRRDFAEAKTVTLRGWILSETEARLCALASVVSAAAVRGERSPRSGRADR